jgi:predicted phosphate transport protein (TIGR00153 family)
MNLNKIFTYLVPKDKVFHGLFVKASANLVQVSATFVEMVNTSDFNQREKLAKNLKDLEQVGDDITHHIFTELSTNFITPFDREDVHYLATAIDDIVDFIYGSSTRLQFYSVAECTPAMIKLAEILQKQTTEIDVAIRHMKLFENVTRIREALVRINSLENNADDVFDEAVANLFLFERDAINIIKIKEILANIETATDKCEDVANVIESIIIKVS